MNFTCLYIYSEKGYKYLTLYLLRVKQCMFSSISAPKKICFFILKSLVKLKTMLRTNVFINENIFELI